MIHGIVLALILTDTFIKLTTRIKLSTVNDGVLVNQLTSPLTHTNTHTDMHTHRHTHAHTHTHTHT